MTETATPARFVIARFGGVRPLARALSAVIDKRVEESTVSRWARNPARRNVDAGYIPPAWHLAILRAAAKNGIDVRPEHLVQGGEIEEPRK